MTLQIPGGSDRPGLQRNCTPVAATTVEETLRRRRRLRLCNQELIHLRASTGTVNWTVECTQIGRYSGRRKGDCCHKGARRTESHLPRSCSSSSGGNWAGSWARNRVTVTLPLRTRGSEIIPRFRVLDVVRWGSSFRLTPTYIERRSPVDF